MFLRSRVAMLRSIGITQLQGIIATILGPSTTDAREPTTYRRSASSRRAPTKIDETNDNDAAANVHSSSSKPAATNSGARARYLLIDVRTTEECNETGMIPGAICVPLDLVDGVLCDGTPKYFRRTFGIVKPSVDDTQLVFYCHSGPRAIRAAMVAEAIGYTAMYFPGGWVEWSSGGGSDDNGSGQQPRDD